MKIIRQNVQTFLYQVVQHNFEKVIKKKAFSMTCKEDREQVTKSRLRLLTELYSLLE